MDGSKITELINKSRSNGKQFAAFCLFYNSEVKLDVDVKIDAVSKLQSEFEAGAEVCHYLRSDPFLLNRALPVERQIPDSDALINTLKACLRTSNQHLTTATITAIPPLLPLLVTTSTPLSQTHSPLSNSTSSSSVASTIDVFSLRQVLLGFLPAGGIIDRLGDAREKARDKARESLIILGGYAFRCPSPSSMSTRSKDAKGPETPLAIFDRFLKEAGLGSKVWRIREQVCYFVICDFR
jgi:CLIP-associating protein 1/2